jgi:hypothetical protein
METAYFVIQPCRSKFILWKVNANKKFEEFIRFFQTGLNAQ